VIKVAVAVPSMFQDAGEFLADVRALEAAGAEWIEVDGVEKDQLIVLGAVAAVTDRIGLRVGDPSALDTLGKLSRGRAMVGEPAGERWETIAMPPDRDSWGAALREREAAGVSGVIVPWDPRLIDLLRNPQPDDRSDLLMSTG
jgi:hypothetical protein